MYFELVPSFLLHEFVYGLLLQILVHSFLCSAFCILCFTFCVWSSVIREVWPAAMVRLDALHAMRRLTSTTSSTQHPWHGFFCATLSDAIFTYDRSELARLRKACLDIYGKQPSQDQIRKHVPRVIVNPMGIVEAIECRLEHFSQQRHARSGQLLTIATQTAWNNLKSHKFSLAKRKQRNAHIVKRTANDE